MFRQTQAKIKLLSNKLTALGLSIQFKKNANREQICLKNILKYFLNTHHHYCLLKIARIVTNHSLKEDQAHDPI